MSNRETCFCSGRLRNRTLTEGVKGYNVGEGRPNRGDLVVCNVKGFFQEEEFQTFQALEFALGEAEVIQALDLVVALMNTAEVRKTLTASLLTVGSLWSQVGSRSLQPTFSSTSCHSIKPKPLVFPLFFVTVMT